MNRSVSGPNVQLAEIRILLERHTRVFVRLVPIIRPGILPSGPIPLDEGWHLKTVAAETSPMEILMAIYSGVERPWEWPNALPPGPRVSTVRPRVQS